MPRLALDTLIFFVTSTCNSRCRTCFYWEELNQTHDLSFDEIERLSTSMPDFNEIWLSGGEPSLRTDLVPILELFYRENGVRSINFPANGLQPEKLDSILRATFERCPELKVNLNLALDGLGETHDRIRGVPGNFGKALESLTRLETLRREQEHLRVHVNSVICRENIHEMVALGDTIRDRFDLDGHYFQIIRGEPMDPALVEVHKSDLGELYSDLEPLYRHYADKLRARKGILGASAYLGVLNLYHEIQASNFERHHRWPMPCTAAQNIAVLDANGDIRSCELRERIGNLRDYDLDWGRFWSSSERGEEIDAIRRDGCWCTHVCFIHASLKASPKAMAIDVPRAFLHPSTRSHKPHDIQSTADRA